MEWKITQIGRKFCLIDRRHYWRLALLGRGDASTAALSYRHSFDGRRMTDDAGRFVFSPSSFVAESVGFERFIVNLVK